MKAIIDNKEYSAKETNGKFFYFSPRTGRWLPTSKSNIVNGL